MKYKYKRNALIVCLLWLASVFAPGNFASGNFASGNFASGNFASGNFASAQTENEISTSVEILMAAPELGSSSISSSFFNQAKKYHDGDGVTQDFLRAKTLYLKAAGMGSNGARINLGYLYFMGEGVEQNYMKARNWYLSAANNGSKDAQLNLAMIYQNGFGVPKDNVKAEYWRTYKQVQTAKKNKAIAAAAAKKSVAAKPVFTQRTVRKPATNAALPVTTKQAFPTLPTLPTLLAAESVIGNNAGIDNMQIAANTEPTLTVSDFALTVSDFALTVSDFALTVSDPASNTVVPKAQQITQQAFVGNAVKSEKNPRSVQSLPRLSEAYPYILSQWVSTVISAIMLILVIMTSVWFSYQYTKIGAQKKARVFAKAFYAHHRDQLRINYLRYPMKHRKIDTMHDTWAVALCVLMVRFAQGKQDEDSLVGLQSNKIIQALKDSPFKAKQAVFPFVRVTQQKIFDDIQIHEYNFRKAPRKCEEPPRMNIKQLAPVVKIKDVLTVEKAKEPLIMAIPKDVLQSNCATLVKRHLVGT